MTGKNLLHKHSWLWIILLLLAGIVVAQLGPPANAQTIPPWEPNTAYQVGDLVAYEGQVYECRQAHTSQVGWDPPNTPALWLPVEGEPDPSPTGEATATQAPATATATPSAPGTCSAPAWEATAVYTGGNIISHNGREWRAKWWTQGEEPGTTGEWGVWEDLGPCDDTPPPPTSTPLPTNTPGPTATPGPTHTPAPSPTPGDPSDKEVVAYFTQWGIYARNYLVRDIHTSGSAATITLINYAFANVQNNECVVGVSQLGVGDAWADYQRSFNASESVDGVGDTWDQALRGNWNQLRKLKEMYPHIRVVISLGGWTWSDGFSDAALPQNRQAFVASCVDAFIHGNLPYDAGTNTGGPGVAAGVFDGIDIDWEYPGVCGNPDNCVWRPEDTQNFTALLAEFRQQLDQIDPNLLLTVAVPAGEDKFEKIELDQIHPYLDLINLMTYDFHGAWNAAGPTNFHSPLYGSPDDPSTGLLATYYSDYAVQAYLDAGVPAHKIILGVPFYGRGWTNVSSANNGLYQSASGAAPGTYEAGIEDYKVLRNLGYPGFRDSQHTQAYWIFNGNTFWSFDDPVSLAVKMNYIQNRGLGGAMIWALDGDTADGELMTAIHNGLKNN
jgi:chitinase